MCHWWDLSKICAYFFPLISESLSSPLIALTSGSPGGLKRAGRKTKAEQGFVLLVMSTGLGQLSWQEGCSSPGSFGPSLWPWVRSCSAQHSLTNMHGVLAWRRNCILVYSRSQRLRVDLSS